MLRARKVTIFARWWIVFWLVLLASPRVVNICGRKWAEQQERWTANRRFIFLLPSSRASARKILRLPRLAHKAPVMPARLYMFCLFPLSEPYNPPSWWTMDLSYTTYKRKSLENSSYVYIFKWWQFSTENYSAKLRKLSIWSWRSCNRRPKTIWTSGLN